MRRRVLHSFSPALLFPGLVSLLSLVDLAGWLTRSPLLTSVIPHSSTMKPNTAICLLLLAIGCWLRRPTIRSQGAIQKRILACIISFALFLSVGTLFEYITGTSFGLDQLVMLVPLDAFGDPPGRMALATAICLTAIGLSILLLDAARRVASWLLLIVGGVAIAALVNFVLDRGPLLGVPWFHSLAIHTALSLLLLSAAGLATRPAQEPIASLLQFAYRGGSESWTLVVLTGVPVLVALPAVIAMRTGLVDAGLTVLGVLIVMMTVQMVSQFRDSLNRRDSN